MSSRTRVRFHDQEPTTLNPAPMTDMAQDISGRDISVAKLTEMLRVQFGDGKYNVCMMHNAYYIKAPRPLSQVSTTWPNENFVANKTLE
jgi:hypothetical protein